MELYTKTAYQQAELLTNQYSTSFSSSSRLFDKTIRPHIYAIYGFVRIADEVVDTYQGYNTLKLLNEVLLFPLLSKRVDDIFIVQATSH